MYLWSYRNINKSLFGCVPCSASVGYLHLLSCDTDPVIDMLKLHAIKFKTGFGLGLATIVSLELPVFQDCFTVSKVSLDLMLYIIDLFDSKNKLILL
jgi:hypothetical protein